MIRYGSERSMGKALIVELSVVLTVLACGNSGAVYVTSGGTDEIIVLDAATGTERTRIAVDPRPFDIDEPHGIASTPSHLFVTVSHGEPTLWKFELPDARLVGRLRLQTAGAGRIGITPDLSRAFIPDYYRDGPGDASQVAVVDLHDLSILSTITACAAPHDAQVDPTGEIVAITCSQSDEIVLVDADRMVERQRFPVGPSPGAAGQPRYRPLNVVWSPDGDQLYVTLHATGELARFKRDGSYEGALAVGAGPAQLAQTPGGQRLVIANRLSRSATLVRTPTFTVDTTIDLDRPHPHGVTVNADGSLAFITYEGDIDTPGGVVALDMQTDSIRWSAEAGSYTLGVIYVTR